ncbi:MAG: hypothetical protein AAGG51_25965 [Cyanobacteria bacterium P01_G01_bin.54]
MIREVAQIKHCTQADLERAIAQHGNKPVTTQEEVLRCWDCYAGPEIKHLRRQTSRDEKVKQQQQDMIEELTDQLGEMRELEAQGHQQYERLIRAQAKHIRKLSQRYNQELG